jgi:hypothetical protein
LSRHAQAIKKGIIHMEKLGKVFSISKWKTIIVRDKELIENKFYKIHRHGMAR